MMMQIDNRINLSKLENGEVKEKNKKKKEKEVDVLMSFLNFFDSLWYFSFSFCLAIAIF